MHRVPSFALLVSTAAVLSACVQPAAAPSAPAPRVPATTPDAVATLRTADGREAGRVSLHDTASGTHLHAQASGLSPGEHGFHIHAHGACGPGPDARTGEPVPFGAAGGHFDPAGTRNHGAPDAPADHVHAGELPQLVADASGRAELHHVNRQVSVAPGKASVMGRSVVVHAGPDDFRSDPDGGSGARVLCGVIEPAQAGPVVGRTVLRGANVFPEGVAIDSATGDRYVGSVSEGHLYRLPAGSGEAELFQTGGSPGRQAAYGLKVDERGQLWVAGGPTGTVAVVDLKTATTRQVLEVPPGPQPFVNDLVVSGPFVYVTDSYRPVVYRVARDAARPQLEPWLDLSRTPVRLQPNEVNLNGIVASADGRWLLAIQQATGQLWRVDTASKSVTEVQLQGGSIAQGDGLVLQGASTLFVVRNAANEVTRVALTPDWSAGQVTQRLQDRRLRYPTTAAVSADGLVVVNGQLDRQKNPPPVLPFDVLTLAVPAAASAAPR